MGALSRKLGFTLGESAGAAIRCYEVEAHRAPMFLEQHGPVARLTDELAPAETCGVFAAPCFVAAAHREV